jgi:hypothetical protein
MSLFVQSEVSVRFLSNCRSQYFETRDDSEVEASVIDIPEK